MTTHPSKYTLTLMTLALGLAVARAQIGALPPPAPKPPTPGAPPPQLSPTEQWIKDVKNPAKGVAWGADLRIRDEYLDNTISLTDADPRHEQNWIRYRGRVWLTLSPVSNFDLNARLTAEPRTITRNRFGNGFAGSDWTEGIIDNLNFKWKQVLGAPLTATVGRQDILLGDYYDWWLVADGTPLDGSRTFYLDAIRLTLDLKDQNTTIDAIGIKHHARNDAWLPPINALEKYQTDQNEHGAILYVSNKSIKNTQVDGYFMYKSDVAKTGRGDTADIYTLGAKITGNVTDHLRYSVEGAYQFGDRTVPASQNISAFGVKNRLTYALKDSMNTQFRLCHEFLSGDDPATATFERFDLLWGRWPRWSELYIYSYINETRVAQNDNVHRFGPGITLTPVKNLDFCADYNALFAPQSSAAAGLFGGGNFRGHYIQAVLKYKFSRHVAAHLWGEWVFAGDYYASRDLFSFLRAEVYLTF